MIKKTDIKAIFFDFDGTLAASLNVMFLAYENFLCEYNIEPSRDEFESLNGPPLNVVIQKLKKTHNLKGSNSFLFEKYNKIIDSLYENVRLNDGASGLIKAAIDNSIILGIVTSNSKKRVSDWLSKNNLNSKFKFIVSAEDVVFGKPHPEPYLLALNFAQLPSSAVVAIEDSRQGVEAAIAANIRTYALTGDMMMNTSREVQISSVASLGILSKKLFY